MKSQTLLDALLFTTVTARPETFLLVQTISLPDVEGRIDRMVVDICPPTPLRHGNQQVEVRVYEITGH